jgi:biofilm PGA synthesis N-glycosyltransferase PgaC
VAWKVAVDATPANEAQARPRGLYLPVRAKFAIAMTLALAWMAASAFVALPWIRELGSVFGLPLAILVIASIAILPGFMNSFLIASLLMDRRPSRKELGSYPPVTILVAAYNEEASIVSTLQSIGLNRYPGGLRVIVIDDGSKDGTAALVEAFATTHSWVELLRQPVNRGKAHALNAGLARVATRLTITVDADCYAYAHAIRHLVERMEADPAGTAAVAGAVHVRNSRKNWITATQEWDYFHGIAAVKRMQSLYQGTLVAQGAFSVYRTDVLREAGGWAQTVGEDIVLTWHILRLGYRVGYAEDAIMFTNAPETLRALVRQRERWSRGMIEAFKKHWPLLFQARLRTTFIWWNLTFPVMDLVYTFFFIPGIVAALFGYFWVVGPMTLLVLPITALVNGVMFLIGRSMFRDQTLRVRRNWRGFLLYILAYSVVMQPACVLGYTKEMFNLRKSWGTK